jgi:hypothetical protein
MTMTEFEALFPRRVDWTPNTDPLLECWWGLWGPERPCHEDATVWLDGVLYCERHAVTVALMVLVHDQGQTYVPGTSWRQAVGEAAALLDARTQESLDTLAELIPPPADLGGLGPWLTAARGVLTREEDRAIRQALCRALAETALRETASPAAA